MEGKDQIKETGYYSDEFKEKMRLFENEVKKTQHEIEYDSLSDEKKILLLKNEIKKTQHEIAISKLVYNCHGEDTYEDLFRDNVPLLEEKISGILLAIYNIENGF